MQYRLSIKQYIESMIQYDCASYFTWPLWYDNPRTPYLLLELLLLTDLSSPLASHLPLDGMPPRLPPLFVLAT